MRKARWSSAVAVAALVALPVAAAAQSTQTTPQQNPPAQSQPPSTTAPQQPPTTQPPATPPTEQPPAQQPTTTAAPPQSSAQGDAAADAKANLVQARESLSQLTTMPEASKLQGNARAQVSQLISSFNALISAKSDWHAAYAKLDSDLNALIGPDTGDHPVGTSGTTAAAGSTELDPALRAKLVEFRTHLKAFEKAASSATASESAAPSSTTNPPTASNPPAAGSNPPATTSTPPTTASNPPSTTSMSSTSSTSGADTSNQPKAGANADAQKELDAISAILSASQTGALTKAETDQLKQHVDALRALLKG